MGTHPAPQDFMWDWNSMTKYEASYIGHTFVARLQSDPSVVIDSYTLEPTRIVDCPASKRQQARSASKEAAGIEVKVEADIRAGGTIMPLPSDQIQAMAPP